MPKKTARVTKPGQQRSKEEQWRRRLAAQGRTGAGSALADTADRATYDTGATDSVGMDVAASDMATGAMPRASRAPTAPASAARTATAPRRTVTPVRTGRVRPGADAMSINEEMGYIRGDIRRLIVLTAVCVVILVALMFVVPSIIR